MPDPIAVVVGMCAHGLSLTRALDRAGIQVVGVEADRHQVGAKTNSADVRFVHDINGPGLVEALISLSSSLSASEPPVLFLTNDTMVRTVGEHYDKLAGLYSLSWGASTTEVLSLLNKNSIAARCRTVGLRHPKTVVIRDAAGISGSKLDLTFPLILKPDTPLSAYKTLIAEDLQQFESLRPSLESALPSLAQEFVPGDESKIRFAALYLVNGEVVARFEGKKLRSRPMGHTSIAVSEANDRMHELAREFFAGLNLNGPVSLEAKEDQDSEFWIIEPTVGRTDFWVGLCIQDGVNLPLVEYNSQCGRKIGEMSQRDQTLWINGQRDPAALFWVAMHYPAKLLRTRIVGVLMSATDITPIARWLGASLRELPVRAVRKVAKLFKSIVRRQMER